MCDKSGNITDVGFIITVSVEMCLLLYDINIL